MKILKLPNPDNARPGTSLWGVEITETEIAALQRGERIAAPEFVLPISEPHATFVLSLVGPAGQ